MSQAVAWIEGKISLGAEELSSPTGIQSKLSSLSKDTVRM